ncbi:MBL fold metallo-hydrolase [Biformimicrobium ophioploci]|uniref:MBL fold metallo-hydrolase n=1 Tax=Biformimicrobium ophioploci TaxID=3036711 RepID=A0ABQ6LUJ4_9GAMM|nr:MBL fold metallo-hydrolase [Microbulbifer sp. NKW57]GMG85751.1 MBL fold metallo-hydrolase [Microbulbifer sp. NKW57]
MSKAIKNISLAILATLIAAGAYLYSQDFRPVVYKVAEKAVEKIVTDSQPRKDDFRLLFCGTGSPNRTPARGQPCTALVANGKLFLFDAGEGAIGKLSEYGAPVGQLGGIFLTHLHSDHISGVAEVLHNTWLYGRRNPTIIRGPHGTEALIKGFESAYDEDLTERNRVLAAENLKRETVFAGAADIHVEGSSSVIVHEENGLTIRAFRVDHPDWHHAFGYRIEHKGKVVVISGDTKASDGIRQYAQGADILIHEALNSEILLHVGEQLELRGAPITRKRMAVIAEAHTSTLELAEIAQQTAAKNLVLTHLIPALPPTWIAEQFFTSGMGDIYKGNIIVARDGQWIDVLGL